MKNQFKNPLKDLTIFESDFDCLTEEQLDGELILEPIEGFVATGTNPNEFQFKTTYFKAKNI